MEKIALLHSVVLMANYATKTETVRVKKRSSLLTKVRLNSNISHSCFPIFKFGIGNFDPFLSICIPLLCFPLQVEVVMYCS